MNCQLFTQREKNILNTQQYLKSHLCYVPGALLQVTAAGFGFCVKGQLSGSKLNTPSQQELCFLGFVYSDCASLGACDERSIYFLHRRSREARRRLGAWVCVRDCVGRVSRHFRVSDFFHQFSLSTRTCLRAHALPVDPGVIVFAGGFRFFLRCTRD